MITAGAVFYFWPYPGPQPNNGEPPTLFSKDDYQIEERSDATYIVVQKAGLTAKVPDNWTIKIEGDDFPTPQYWVNLLSPDVEMTSILQKGCSIEIIASQNSPKEAQTLQNNINLIKKDPSASDAIRKNYTFKITQKGEHVGLEWFSPENEPVGEFIGVDIPLDKNKKQRRL